MPLSTSQNNHVLCILQYDFQVFVLEMFDKQKAATRPPANKWDIWQHGDPKWNLGC